MSNGRHLILYDGVCGLCNRLNNFVLPRDREGRFHFASLQSALGRSILERHGRDPGDLTTFYVVADYRSSSSTLRSRSDAALFLMRNLGRPWRWFAAFRILPRPLCDRIYDLVARNRYRLFGRVDTCPAPSPEYRSRFVDV